MSIGGEALQRLRIAYTKGEPLRHISHLDMMRLWERAFRRAGLPVAHTQGFNPRPRIGMACPLPTGVTSRAELLDVFLTERRDEEATQRRLSEVLPDGIEVLEVREVDLRMPALMSLPAQVEYQCRVHWDGPAESLESALAEWLAQDSVIRQRQKKSSSDTYDLRRLVECLWVVCRGGEAYVIGMTVRSGPEGTGRPDEVLKSLQLWDGAAGVERTALLLPEPG